MASWKQESEVYKTRMYEKYGITLRESFDAESFKKNPKKFFNENNWIIPQEHFEEIVSLLAGLAQSDSEISFEDVELGKRGEYIQEVVQKLMQTDKNFAANINKVMSNTRVQEGKKLVTFLVCLGLLLGAMGAAHASTGQNISNNQGAPNQGAAITQTIENEDTKEIVWKISVEKNDEGGYNFNISVNPEFEGDPNLNDLAKNLEGNLSLAISTRLNQMYEDAVQNLVSQGFDKSQVEDAVASYLGESFRNSNVNIIFPNQGYLASHANDIPGQSQGPYSALRNAFSKGYKTYLSGTQLSSDLHFYCLNN